MKSIFFPTPSPFKYLFYFHRNHNHNQLHNHILRNLDLELRYLSEVVVVVAVHSLLAVVELEVLQDGF